MKKIQILVLILFLSSTTFAQKISAIETRYDSAIYQQLLDSMPDWIDVKIFGRPRLQTAFTDSIDKLLLTDTFFLFNGELRQKYMGERKPLDTLMYGECDSCRYVAYVFEPYYYTEKYYEFLRNEEFSKSRKIKWNKDFNRRQKIYDYSSRNLTYLAMDPESKSIRINEAQSMVERDADFKNHGDYYIGWFAFSTIIYSRDFGYAFVLVNYNEYYVGGVYYKRVGDQWVVESHDIKYFCCF